MGGSIIFRVRVVYFQERFAEFFDKFSLEVVSARLISVFRVKFGVGLDNCCCRLSSLTVTVADHQVLLLLLLLIIRFCCYSAATKVKFWCNCCCRLSGLVVTVVADHQVLLLLLLQIVKSCCYYCRSSGFATTAYYQVLDV